MLEAELPKRLYISTGLNGVTSRRRRRLLQSSALCFLYLYSYSRYLLSIQDVTTMRCDCPKGIRIVLWRVVKCLVTGGVNLGRACSCRCQQVSTVANLAPIQVVCYNLTAVKYFRSKLVEVFSSLRLANCEVHCMNISTGQGPVWVGQRIRYSDWLRAGWSGDRIPVGARFSAPVQTGPVAHPASCTMGTGSFPGVKSGRGVTLTPHPLLVPWS